MCYFDEMTWHEMDRICGTDAESTGKVGFFGIKLLKMDLEV
jgi:hypothetical protein